MVGMVRGGAVWGAIVWLLTTGPAVASSADPMPSKVEVYEASIEELQAAQSAGQVTARQLVEKYLARIAAYDQAGPRLNAIVTLNPRALTEADALDKERRIKGPRGLLHGVPVLLKDNYSTIGMPTTAGTMALATMQTADDAFVVRRLKAAGAIILGKATLQELAVGVTTISSLTGKTRNPYDLVRSPGGSSGGTAAAVAASFAAAGTGSDTCASIRVPPAFQNLFGMRSTMGLVSRAGIVPLSSGQDIAGPITRSVRDLAIMLDVMAGTDPDDPVTKDADQHHASPYLNSVQPEGLRGARIGVIRELFSDSPDGAEGLKLIESAFAKMRAHGATVVDVPMPAINDMLSNTSVIVFNFKYELAAFLAKQPSAPVKSLSEILDQDLDHEIVDARLRDRNAPAVRDEVSYASVLQRRAALRNMIIAALNTQHLDALAFPVSQQGPPLIGLSTTVGGNCQLSASTGLPALSVPLGFLSNGLPIGLELMGADYGEAALFRVAGGWEHIAMPRRAPFSTPPLVGGHAPPPMTFTVQSPASLPGPRTKVKAKYDLLTGRLDLRGVVSGAKAHEVIGVMVHRGDGDRSGPVIERLLAQGHLKGASQLTLDSRDREAFFAGRLSVRTYTRAHPLGLSRIVLMPPTPGNAG